MAKILAIDEKNEILQRIKFVLERENNKVITAFGSEEGLDIFNKYCNTIDIVIIDTKLLINSEMELLRKVKKILPHLSVMVLAEHDDMENAILAIKEGAFGYIKSPL